MRLGNVERVIIGRLSRGQDVLRELTEIVRRNGVKSGAVMLIGSLDRVRVGFFNEETGTYDYREAEGFYELVSGLGNVSWKDSEPVVHIHIAASSHDGDYLMGHLLEGNIASLTVEYIILAFDFMVQRRYDPGTKLSLLDTE